MSQETVEEINFLLDNFDGVNGFLIWPVSPLVQVLSYSDASDRAWGGFVGSMRDTIAKGTFADKDVGTSSTLRELKPL